MYHHAMDLCRLVYICKCSSRRLSGGWCVVIMLSYYLVDIGDVPLAHLVRYVRGSSARFGCVSEIQAWIWIGEAAA